MAFVDLQEQIVEEFEEQSHLFDANRHTVESALWNRRLLYLAHEAERRREMRVLRKTDHREHLARNRIRARRKLQEMKALRPQDYKEFRDRHKVYQLKYYQKWKERNLHSENLVCAQCGHTYSVLAVVSVDSRRRYCSFACKDKYTRRIATLKRCAMRRERTREMRAIMGDTRKCAFCGSDFANPWPEQLRKYCSMDCRIRSKRAKAKARSVDARTRDHENIVDTGCRMGNEQIVTMEELVGKIRIFLQALHRGKKRCAGETFTGEYPASGDVHVRDVFNFCIDHAEELLTYIEGMCDASGVREQGGDHGHA